MSIRVPESRLIIVGPGQLIDPITGSGFTVAISQCGHPNVALNQTTGKTMRKTSYETWINRCTNGGRQIQIARVTARVYCLVDNFAAGSEFFLADTAIDPDGTVIAKSEDTKGILTKGYDLSVQMGFSPQAACV